MVYFFVKQEQVLDQDLGGGSERNFPSMIYKLVSVPLDHTDSSSEKDVLLLQWFYPINHE